MVNGTSDLVNPYRWLFLAPALILSAGDVGAISWGGDLTATTDYVSKRGVSLTDGDPALQGELHAETLNGAYFGIWGSNVDFDPVWGEIDLFAGIMRPVIGEMKAGVGIIHYENLGDSSQNFQDYFVNAAYGRYLKLMYSYTPDFSGIDQQAGFAEFTSIIPVSPKVSVKLHGGRKNFWGNKDILENFYVWQAALRHKSGKSDISLNFSDTTSDQFLGRADRRVYLSFKYNW